MSINYGRSLIIFAPYPYIWTETDIRIDNLQDVLDCEGVKKWVTEGDHL